MSELKKTSSIKVIALSFETLEIVMFLTGQQLQILYSLLIILAEPFTAAGSSALLVLALRFIGLPSDNRRRRH